MAIPVVLLSRTVVTMLEKTGLEKMVTIRLQVVMVMSILAMTL